MYTDAAHDHVAAGLPDVSVNCHGFEAALILVALRVAVADGLVHLNIAGAGTNVPDCELQYRALALTYAQLVGFPLQGGIIQQAGGSLAGHGYGGNHETGGHPVDDHDIRGAILSIVFPPHILVIEAKLKGVFL